MKKKKKRIKHPFRDTFLTKHHILPRFYGGIGHPSNLLRLWEDKHIAWHRLFGLAHIETVIHNFYLYRHKNYTKDWKLVFGNKTDFACKSLLRRVLRFKHNLK